MGQVAAGATSKLSLRHTKNIRAHAAVEFLFGVKLLAADAVETAVGLLINIAIPLTGVPELPDTRGLS